MSDFCTETTSCLKALEEEWFLHVRGAAGTPTTEQSEQWGEELWPER